jgi:hypothetical protein
MLLLCAAVSRAADLKPETIEAFDRYIASFGPTDRKKFVNR